MTTTIHRIVAVFVSVLPTTLVTAGESDYVDVVKPILRERCYSCHGALKQEAGLRLDTVESIHKGGTNGRILDEQSPDASELLQRVSTSDTSLRMPPEGTPLKAEQIEHLRRWLQQGATGPVDETPDEDPRQHWAFQKPVRPAVPAVPGDAPLHPIDAFLHVRRQSRGITAMPSADGATLLRRLYLDLTGLPPTAEELQTFLQDSSPTAFEAVADRLLDSPTYGERWGRHWMDVWRYSDWYGRRSVPDVMNSYPMVWRWRDWIIRSLNDDKPYHQMILEMLAADELMPTRDQDVVATGYLVRSWFKWNYETWKKDLVEHTGKAFLGLTLNCAQCHDHKYDPISQEEYFRFRAFFEPLELRHDRVPGEPDPGMFEKYIYGKPYGPIKTGMVRVFDETPDAETFMFSKGDSRLKIEGKPPVKPGAPALLGGALPDITRQTLPLEAAYPGMKDFVRREERAKRQTAMEAAAADLAKARETMNSEPAELRQELEAAETHLKTVRETALQRISVAGGPSADGQPVRLNMQGAQWLVLDAKAGRRALSHALPGIDGLSDGGTVSYLVGILQDGHTNLQLGLDISQGATGGFVAFENGKIKTYQPGGFSEFVAGTYDLARGQNRFRVEMKLDLTQNQFLLHVTSVTDNLVIVNDVPAALNGWMPQDNGRRGLFLDCRPGTEALYDDLTFCQPQGTVLLKFDFEEPQCHEGQDLVEIPASVGSVPWMLTRFCEAPATSLIGSAAASDPDVQSAVTRLASARHAVRLPAMRIAAAEARVAAAELERQSLEARIAADSARYFTGLLAEDRCNEPDIRALISEAWRLERESAVALAKADLVAADVAVAEADLKVATAANSSDSAAIETAGKERQTALTRKTAATTALSTAMTAIAREPGEYSPLSPKYPQVTSGRRSVLARWIASENNPLTARVAVNHIWLRHFGQAIVESTHDFGRNGSRPTHPELLDWLACELMDSGWSMKHIHRLIVTSQAYRMASMIPRSAGLQATEHEIRKSADPDNRTYWRFPSSRMQAEVVRDSLLAVAGELDRTMGGHEIDHHEGMKSHRRSLYFAHHGEERMEFLELFDAANACECYRRTSSVQPQQALALTNSELTKSLSRTLAQRLWEKVEKAPDAAEQFIQLAFLQILNREPQPEEAAASREFLTLQPSRIAASLTAAPSDSDASTAAKEPPAGASTATNAVALEIRAQQRSRENLVHALMNHNDFVTVR